jgi:hypothetical protein
MSVLTKLMQARIELQQTPLKKSGHNKFAGYHYFELGDFLPTVQQIFAKIGLCGFVSYTAELATLNICDIDSVGTLQITSPMGSAALKGCHEVQNIGAVETYQRRYLWVTAMEIVEHDILDATTGSDKKGPSAPITPTTGVWESLTDEQRTILSNLAGVIKEYVSDQDCSGAYEALDAAGLDADERAALGTQLDSKTRTAMSKWRKENPSNQGVK